MREKLAHVPAKPGVYLFRDPGQSVLYVGKAKDLKNRLRSYFQKTSAPDRRKTAMIREAVDFEYTVTGNELEAFVLEANLIKQYRPRYNVLLRDDKSYPYLRLSVNEEWPCLEVVRRVKRDGARYYGPYVPAGAMWDVLSYIRNTFHIRSCTKSLDRIVRPCIKGEIGKCAAPCSGRLDRADYMKMVDEVRLLLEGKNRRLIASLEQKMRGLSDAMRYEEAAAVRDRIQAVEKISESQKVVAPGLGDIDAVGMFRRDDRAWFKVLFVRNGMMIGSRHFVLKGVSGETDGYLLRSLVLQFYNRDVAPPPEILFGTPPEEADILARWLSQKRGGNVHLLVPRRGLKKELVGMAEENAEILAESSKGEWEGALKDLAAFLGLGAVPDDIGAFDISNIAGSAPVGAFVYWAEGTFRKERYRHIRMDAVPGPDDFAMMAEMVRRTLAKPRLAGSGPKGLRREPDAGDVPDLIVVDGGKGQLDAACRALFEAGIRAEVIGVAKDPDRVFMTGGRRILDLGGGGPAQLLLRRIRDEAHRFAVAYHRKLRSERTFESPLEKVPGVGRKRRLELLRHFESIGAIRKASVDEITAIKGFPRKTAERLIEYLAKNTGAE